MSDRTLRAVIETVDKNSASVFRQVSDGAQRMGTSISTAAKQASASLKENERATQDLNTRMAALGAVITGGAAVLGQWSRSSQEAQAIQRGLESAIAATGDEYSVYAERIEAAGAAAVRLGQDDEAASQAISALTQITGSASTALDHMGLVMDLAAAKHMSLESAAELVGRVLEGNVGILNRQGFAIAENATAQEALATVQAAVAGQAEAQATTYGRLREEISNLTDSIGGAVGEFAPMLALLPGVSSGLALAGSAAGALAPNLTKAGAASKLLSLAVGPGGLVVAFGAAALAGKALSDWLDGGYTEAVHSAREASVQLIDTLNLLAETGSSASGMGAEWRATLVGLGSPVLELEKNIERARAQLAKAREDAKLPGADNAWLIRELETTVATLEGLRQAYGDSATAAREYAETLDAIGAIAAHTGPGQEAIRAEAEKLHDEFQKAGIPGLKAYGDGMQDLAGSMGEYDRGAATLTKTVAGQVAAWKDQEKALDANVDLLTDYATKMGATDDEVAKFSADLNVLADAGGEAAGRIGVWTKALDSGAMTLTEVEQRAGDLADQIQGQESALGDASRAMADYGRTATETTAALALQNRKQEESITSLDGVALSVRDLQEAWDAIGPNKIDDSSRAMQDLGESASEAAGAFALLQRTTSMGDLFAGGGLSTGDLNEFADAIGNTESAFDRVARGSSSAAVQLRAFKEVQDGIISSQGPYNHQLSEYGQQLDYLQNAEDLLNQRRAEGQQLTADQLDYLARVDAAQERLTGGTEDATLALGEQALQYAENMSIGDALNQNLDGVSKTTGELTDTIRDLINTLNGVPEDVETDVSVPGATESIDTVSALSTLIDDVGSKDVAASVSVNGVVEALGNLAALDNLMRGIDGDHATLTIDEVRNYHTNYFNNTYGVPPGMALHGGVSDHLSVPSYAQGGIVAQMAEAGPEMVTTRGGGQWLAMSRGLYALTPGDYVHNAAATSTMLGGGGQAGGRGGGLRGNGRGSGGIVVTGPVYIYPATNDVAQEFRSALIGHARR